MIEQAAFDRNLYQSAVGSSHINLKFPEFVFPFFKTIMDIRLIRYRIFNTGSPYNVSAGQGAANMDKLVAHYDQLNKDAEAKKAEKQSK